MRIVVIGMGVQGAKRSQIAGNDVVAKVDPVAEGVDFRNIQEVPLHSFDAALVCTPDDAKIEILSYLLSNSKHVLVEKPLLSADNSDLITLLNLAKQKNVLCYTAYNHRFEPCLARAKEIVASGEIGQVLSFSMFYGNGTARLVRQSPWRDKGMGVLADLGSHLLDTLYFILGDRREDLIPFSCNTLENKSYDYVLFGSTIKMPRVQLEGTLLSWRNDSSLDIIGSEGSIHTSSFCKWGTSRLVKRIRMLPSGRPIESEEIFPEGDPTWKLEYEYFNEQIKNPQITLDRDIWINSSLASLYNRSLKIV